MDRPHFRAWVDTLKSDFALSELVGELSHSILYYELMIVSLQRPNETTERTVKSVACFAGLAVDIVEPVKVRVSISVRTMD